MLNCLNNLSHHPGLPSFLKIGLLICLGVHLELSPCKLGPQFFFLRPPMLDLRIRDYV